MYPQRAMGPPKPNVPSRRKYASSWPTEYDGSTVRFSASTTLRIGALYHIRKRKQIRASRDGGRQGNSVAVIASPDLQAQDLLIIVDAQQALAYGPALMRPVAWSLFIVATLALAPFAGAHDAPAPPSILGHAPAPVLAHAPPPMLGHAPPPMLGWESASRSGEGSGTIAPAV